MGDDRQRFPLGDIPVLDVDGVPMCETNAIYMYIGQLTGLWPTNPLDCGRAMEVLLTIELIFTGMTYGPNDYNLMQTFEAENPSCSKAFVIS